MLNWMFNWDWKTIFRFMLFALIGGFVAVLVAERLDSFWPGFIWFMITLGLMPIFVRRPPK